MKKLLIPALLLIASIGSVNAQDGREDFHLGLKAGANYSNIYDESDNAFEADGKLGFAGGAFVAIPLGRFLGIQPEILYSQKGYRAGGTLLGTSYEYTRTLSYIDIPLQLAIKPAPGFTIVLGPQYSYLINRKDVIRSGTFSETNDQDFENEDIRKNTLCMVGGFDFTIAGFVIAPRAGIDFMNNNGDGTQTTPRYKNNWVQLTVGFRF